MGVQHIEDLDIDAFVKTVKNISAMHGTEKLDGAQLWFGLDKEGQLFTSRAGKRKSAENIYNEGDYPYFAANNGFRAAHAALKEKETEIKSVLRPGDTIEVEVLFGRQPNAVVYGAGDKNYIAFLRGVEGTQDILVDQLAQRLANQLVKVNVKVVDTVDGENLTLEPRDLNFQFVAAQKVDTATLKQVNVSKQLASLERFLKQRADLEGTKVTNFDVLTASLASFDKEVRAAAKDLRGRLQAQVLTDFKLPIKKELLARFVHQVKSPLAASDLSADEDIGIEGVVLRTPGTEEQVKLVDKDLFTTLNQFNHSVRSSINGVVKTTDMDAPLESRGGLLGELKILIADLLGNKELARTQGAKKVFATFKGKTPEDTLRNVARELAGGDDYRSTQRKVLALIGSTQEKLATQLKDFKANKDNFRLKLKSGKSMGLSPEVIRRTLVTFAESKRDLDELAEKVKKSKGLPQLAAVLYGRIAKAMHSSGEELTEQVLTETYALTDKTQYQNKDAWSLLNIYFATVMMSTVIYKADDKHGVRLLKDKTHCRLSKWTRVMSPLNFWGYIIWRIGTPSVAKLVGKKVAKDLFRQVRKVPPNHWRFLHMDLSFGRDVPIDWQDHRQTLRKLQEFPSMDIDRVNTLLDGAFTYDQLTFDEKVKFLGKLYFYVNQFIPTSILLSRIRVIQDQLLLNANGENYQLVGEMKLLRSVTGLTEEGEGGGNGGAAVSAAAPASSTSTATTAAAIAPLEKRLTFRIKRRQWQKPKFENPSKVNEAQAGKSVADLNIEYSGGDFSCSSNQLTSLVGAPSSVGGDFFCSNNKLTSLVGAPSSVGDSFYCHNNQLTSLVGAPSSVGGDFSCSSNQLTSLVGAPSSVGGGFDCSHNKLTSLEGAPSSVGGSFWCDNNKLTSLEGAPSSVGGDFYCSDNQLTSLKGAPSSVGGGFYCENNQLTSLRSIHRIIKEINGSFYCHGNPIKSDLLYILLIKGVKGVLTPFSDIDEVINQYLKDNPSGSMKAVFDVREMLNNKGLTAP